MLDSKCKFILNYINDACKNGEFKIFTIDEIVSKYNKNQSLSLDSVAPCFRELNASGYIRCKYDDGYSFCATITEKGISFIKEKNNDIPLTVNYNNGVLGWCFFLSFLGGFIGSLFSTIIAFFARL